ncbi:CRIB domain-containing protein RIC4-like [Typha angustifolia]|uniref:CRIB domain-containing protein RIC4-like n=1 Tax=Typha angustifolia TaxID=59011 RepID=UPI003C2DAAAA
MRDRRMERFAVLPFSIGCVSQSSVAVIDDQPKKPHAEPTSTPPSGEDEGQCNIGKPRSSSGLSAGLQKLIKSFKSTLSQFFVVYEEDEEDEREMEIGLPTDVQHVGHIGWDGLNNLSSMKSWDDRAPELLSLPSLSMRQFELAMASQAVGPPQSTTLCSQ